MDQAEYVVIVDEDDVYGRALLSALQDEERSHIWVDFDQNRVRVPVDILVMETDRRYRLPARLAAFGDTEETAQRVTVPVVEETASLRTEEREVGAVRVEKTVRTEEEVIEVPLTATEVEVERVAVDRIVDEPVSQRREGDTLIVPVFEEVLVVEKKLRLKEEIHITTRRTTEERRERVTLRKEEVAIERDEPDEELI